MAVLLVLFLSVYGVALGQWSKTVSWRDDLIDGDNHFMVYKQGISFNSSVGYCPSWPLNVTACEENLFGAEIINMPRYETQINYAALYIEGGVRFSYLKAKGPGTFANVDNDESNLNKDICDDDQAVNIIHACYAQPNQPPCSTPAKAKALIDANVRPYFCPIMPEVQCYMGNDFEFEITGLEYDAMYRCWMNKSFDNDKQMMDYSDSLAFVVYDKYTGWLSGFADYHNQNDQPTVPKLLCETLGQYEGIYMISFLPVRTDYKFFDWIEWPFFLPRTHMTREDCFSQWFDPKYMEQVYASSRNFFPTIITFGSSLAYLAIF